MPPNPLAAVNPCRRGRIEKRPPELSAFNSNAEQRRPLDDWGISVRQVIQNVRTRTLSIADVPDPLVRPGHLLIQNVCSMISAGTEKSVIDLASKSLIGKARARPDQVRQVLQKIKTQGLWATFE